VYCCHAVNQQDPHIAVGAHGFAVQQGWSTHWRDRSSIQSNGFFVLKDFSCPSDTSRRSAQNAMYSAISSLFMPMRLTGRASHKNSVSMATASRTISSTRSPSSLLFRSLQNDRTPYSGCSKSKRRAASSRRIITSAQ
jgi:hypothetical protein